MSRAPSRCGYCDGTDKTCGFCEMGVPLDTQDDWDKSWGRVFLTNPSDHSKVEM